MNICIHVTKESESGLLSKSKGALWNDLCNILLNNLPNEIYGFPHLHCRNLGTLLQYDNLGHQNIRYAIGYRCREKTYLKHTLQIPPLVLFPHTI